MVIIMANIMVIIMVPMTMIMNSILFVVMLKRVGFSDRLDEDDRFGDNGDGGDSGDVVDVVDGFDGGDGGDDGVQADDGGVG